MANVHKVVDVLVGMHIKMFKQEVWWMERWHARNVEVTNVWVHIGERCHYWEAPKWGVGLHYACEKVMGLEEEINCLFMLHNDMPELK